MTDAITRRAALTGAGASLALAACARGQVFEEQALAPGWTSGPSLPIRVQEIYPAVLSGTIYVAGGLSPDTGTGSIGITDRVFALTPGAGEWRERAPLPLPVHHPNLVALDGYLYAVGGFTAENGGAWTMSRAVRLYDESRNQWSAGPDMSHPFAETVAAALNGRIHVVTGRRPAGSANRAWSDHADTNAHIVLDPATGNWLTAPPAPTARNSAAGAALAGRLHVVGGRTVTGGNTPAHEVYDPGAQSWERAAPLPEPAQGPRGAGGLAAAALGDALYVFGGEWFDNSGGGVYRQVWAYDAAEDRWREAGAMPTPRHGLGAVVRDEAIWTIAGAAQAGGNETSAAVEVFTPSAL
ncbi:MAG: Kelch repeat-containing protein [Oceanicaulis sp.]